MRRSVATLSLGLLALLAPAHGPAQARAPGDVVENTATIRHDGADPIATNTATFTVETRRTPSTITFLRHAPGDPACVPTNVAPTRILSGPTGGVETPASGVPRTLGGVELNLGDPLCLTEAETYVAGELIFLSVADAGENADPTAVETLVVTVASGNGDEITLVLTETGPDTGVFAGYVQSGRGTVSPTDDLLTLEQGTELTATYRDRFDATEVSVDVAAVSPATRVFDSVTGALLDGVAVTVLDATGAPATVLGPDGGPGWPSTVVTGGRVEGPNGAYALGPGEFHFPSLPPGTYRLRVETPPGYTAPSVASPDALTSLTGGFVVQAGSFLGGFTLVGGQGPGFDVPLDPETTLTVRKEAGAQTAARGDLVAFTVTAEAGAGPARLSLRDVLPRGLRYQDGTARLDGRAVAVSVASDGRTLTIDGGVLPAGTAARLTYLTRVSAGARAGEAVNAVTAIGGRGDALSNTARASVLIRDDALTSRVTLIGRVAADACDPDEDWPRAVTDGIGVPGVRLVLETGQTVVTDADGLYGFDDLSPRAHVVQIDEESLPAEYELVACEEDSRAAGSASGRIVDALAGTVTRADFYVARKDGRAATASEEAAAEARAAPGFDDFGEDWLHAQTTPVSMPYPAAGYVPTTRSLDLGLAHPHGAQVTLTVNGAPVAYAQLAERRVTEDRTRALSSWRGVDIQDGENVLEAVVTDSVTGLETARITRTVWFVTEPTRAEVATEASFLTVGEARAPEIALRLTDAAGRPVHPGRRVAVRVDPPYAHAVAAAERAAMPIGTPTQAAEIVVGEDGLAVLRLAPTQASGVATVRVPTLMGDQVLRVPLRVGERGFVVAGLVEATGGEIDPLPGQDDARVALYAKGTVRGGWLVTAAVDTDKEERDREELLRQVAPDDRFALRGDASVQEFDAQSRLPLYLRAEKGAVRAELGDYDTQLSEARLGRYDRRLTGVRAAHVGERVDLRAFAAEGEQDFVRDEIASDGTSGPYRLSRAPLIRNSEVLVVETRDAFRPDVVLGVRPLERWVDYEVDYETGALILRAPVPASEGLTGLNTLVATYETDGLGGEALIAGGRAALTGAGGRVTLGVTAAYEEETADQARRTGGDLLAADLTVRIGTRTELRAEAGRTDTPQSRAEAILVEGVHAGERIRAEGWFAQTDAGYGLGQVSSARAGARRYGARASVPLGVTDTDGQRSTTSLAGEASREENLETGADRTLAAVELRREGGQATGALGLRAVQETGPNGEARETVSLTSALRRVFPRTGTTLSLAHDETVAGDQTTLYAQRTALGVEQRIFGDAVLSVRHEVRQQGEGETANTVVALKGEPWAGARVSVSGDQITQDSGARLGATFGVDQQVAITDKLTATLGATRRVELDNDGVVEPAGDVLRDAAVSPLEAGAEFLSVTAGLGFRAEATLASVRAEVREDARGKRMVQTLGVAREVSEVLSVGGAVRAQQFDAAEGGTDADTVTARIGAAYRPRGEGLVVLQRLDLERFDTETEERSRLVHTLAATNEIGERAELSLTHAVRHVAYAAEGIDASVLTQFGAAELRYDVTERVDVGFRATATYDHEGDALAYAYGPSVGVSPADGVWLGVGYNVAGYAEPGFEAAERTEEGAYVQLRLKLDRDSLKGLLNHVTPRSPPEPGA